VPDERLRAGLVIDKLAQEFRRYFTFEVIRWEHEPLIASGHFQDALDPPSAADIVILILWSRLGTPLPEKTSVREYRGIDGRVPVTGTEWEYEDALKSARERGAPDLVAFRNTSPTQIDPRDPDARARSIAQLDALDAFWRRHFADRGVFLAAYDEYATLDQFAARLEETLRKLIERRIKALPASEAPAATWFGPPFRGLQAYGFEHGPIYFGRDEAVAKAIEQLAANARAGTAFLLVCGASGSGKSSLVQAALVPRLMQPQRIEGVAFARRLVFRPGGGGDPILGLVEALTRQPGQERIGLPELLAPGQTAVELAAHLRETADKPGFVFAGALARLTEAGRADGRLLAFETARLVLVVDQLEELLTVASISAEDQRRFMRLLAGLARSGAVWVIATLRADFWHRAAEIPELLELAQGGGRVDLAAPSLAELAEMIRRPAEAAGLLFETNEQSGLGLDIVIAADTAASPGAQGYAETAPGVLPLLSFLLDELYAEDVVKRGGKTLTFATYSALGRLRGAMSKRAEDTVAALPEPAQAAIPQVLRTLVTIAGGSDQAIVARLVPLARFAEDNAARIVVDTLIRERLLVASKDGETSTVRLAHEALIGHWERARRQFAADRRDLETRTLVEQQQARWEKAGGRAKRQLLLRDPDLANALALDLRWGKELDARTRAFIGASRRRARLLQQLMGTAAAIFAAVAIFAGWQSRQADTQRSRAEANSTRAEQQRSEAEKNLAAAQVTQSRFLASLATRSGADAATAILLALEALPDIRAGNARPYVGEAETALFGGWQNIREIAGFHGHTDQVLTAAFSADGRRIVTASSDMTARIWDAETGRTIAILQGHKGPVWSAAFSADGRRVVTSSNDNTARVWDAETGRMVAVLQHDEWVRSAAFSADGRRIVTASDDKTAHVWDTETGSTIAVLRGHAQTVQSAEFSADGRRVVTASFDGTARIWDAGTGEAGAVLEGHGDSVWNARFSADGRRVVTASYDQTARVWDAETGSTIVVLRGHEGPVWSAVFSPDGRRVLTASKDKTARVWDLEARKMIILRGHGESVVSAVFSADGRRVATASEDKTARVWDAETGGPVAVLQGHDEWMRTAVFSADGRRVLTASDDGTARLWNVETGTKIVLLRGHELTVWSAGFSADGRRVVTASSDRTARVWDAETGRTIAVLRGHEIGVTGARFSADGRRVVTTSSDSTARVWDAETGRTIAVLEGHEGQVNSAMFSADGRRVVTASVDETARVWDAETGRTIAVLRGHDGWVLKAAFSADGRRVVTASVDGAARIWDAESGRTLVVLEGHAAAVAGATFSPDGRRVLTASADKTARVWDAETGRTIAVLQGHEGIVTSAAFSADGRRVVTVSKDKTARVWDAETGTPVAVLQGHKGDVESAVFSPDGRRVVTASWDETARVWDAETGTAVAILLGHTNHVSSAAFSPDGRRVVTASWDATVRIWRVFAATQDLVDAAKTAVPRCLTRDQRTNAFLAPEPPAWCIEAERWPYGSPAWKDWLKYKRANANPPLPDTPAWKAWIAERAAK
jgi:WD40 repeat protein